MLKNLNQIDITNRCTLTRYKYELFTTTTILMNSIYAALRASFTYNSIKLHSQIQLLY